MRDRTKTLILLIATQLAGLAVGLWIHHRFVAFSVSQAVYEEGWSALEAAQKPAAAAIEELDDPQLPPQDVLSRLQQQASSAGLPHLQLILVDQHWNVLASSGTAKALRSVQWKSAPAGGREPTVDLGDSAAPRLGSISSGDQRHPALALPTTQGTGYLVIYQPFDSLRSAPTLLQKPLLPAALITFLWTGGILSIMGYLILARLYDRIARKSAESETAALRHTESMARMRDAVIFGLAKLTESRDPETGQHLERISLYCTKLAQALRHHPKFRELVTPEFVRLIGVSSILHDIGKVGIEDAILLKPAPLSPSERERMQEHSSIGGVCIQDIERRLGSSNFLQMARQIAFSHHERWDGQGYPHRLTRNEIPLAARIVAIADVYEALSTRRVYKEAMPHEQCVAYIREQAGKHFDPTIVEVFLRIEGQFQDICRRYRDASENTSSSPERQNTIPFPVCNGAPDSNLVAHQST